MNQFEIEWLALAPRPPLVEQRKAELTPAQIELKRLIREQANREGAKQ